MCAVTVFEGELSAEVSRAQQAIHARSSRRARSSVASHPRSEQARAWPAAGSASILDETKLRRVLAKMLDENEFLEPLRHPVAVALPRRSPVCLPASAARNTASPICRPNPTRGMFGGNSNWRGPIWMPVNALIIRALLQYYAYYGDELHGRMPHRLGPAMNLYQVAEEIARRLASIFLRDEDGRRPVYGGTQKFQDDPHWRDCILFYEYFHGDNGAGLGASHQTGWTGIDRPRSCTCSRRSTPGTSSRAARSLGREGRPRSRRERRSRADVGRTRASGRRAARDSRPSCRRRAIRRCIRSTPGSG